ncbi:MAG: hypothetical protein E7331_00825 [Clostridiales bacterium]|nr:hypothetical protein [Clostridiales bacterium]
MKNYKGNTLLIELIIVLLFFALSQTVVVSMFAASHEKAEHSSLLSSALMYTEGVAERLSIEENPDTALLEMGYAGGDGNYAYTDPQGFDVSVSLRREEKAAGEMIYATITATGNGSELVSLPVQRYLPKEGEQ